MDIKKQGTEFLNKITVDTNATFMESVKAGFAACFEGESGQLPSIDPLKVYTTEQGSFDGNYIDEGKVQYDCGAQIIEFAAASPNIKSAYQDVIEYLKSEGIEIDPNNFAIDVSASVGVETEVSGSYSSASADDPGDSPSVDVIGVTDVVVDDAVGNVIYVNETEQDFQIDGDAFASKLAIELMQVSDIEESIDEDELYEKAPAAPKGFSTTYYGAR
jgi:hypothetical protein